MSVIMEVDLHGFDHKKDVEKSPFFTGFPLTYSPFQPSFFFFFYSRETFFFWYYLSIRIYLHFHIQTIARSLVRCAF